MNNRDLLTGFEGICGDSEEMKVEIIQARGEIRKITKRRKGEAEEDHKGTSR